MSTAKCHLKQLPMLNMYSSEVRFTCSQDTAHKWIKIEAIYGLFSKQI